MPSRLTIRPPVGLLVAAALSAALLTPSPAAGAEPTAPNPVYDRCMYDHARTVTNNRAAAYIQHVCQERANPAQRHRPEAAPQAGWSDLGQPLPGDFARFDDCIFTLMSQVNNDRAADWAERHCRDSYIPGQQIAEPEPDRAQRIARALLSNFLGSEPADPEALNGVLEDGMGPFPQMSPDMARMTVEAGNAREGRDSSAAPLPALSRSGGQTGWIALEP